MRVKFSWRKERQREIDKETERKILRVKGREMERMREQAREKDKN
jgi:hypothetical protein